MGSPKALLEIGGVTFLDRLIEVFSVLCNPVIAVLGHHADAIQSGIARSEQAVIVVNPSPEAGMLSSLQAGLAAVPSRCRSVFFHPCDMPEIRRSTLDQLIGSLERSPAEVLAAAPTVDGKRGHPVLIRSAWIPAFLALPSGATARRLLESAPQPIVEVEVEDPAVRRDFDTPEQFSAAFGVKP
jgi:molybdenum cofactor cytidylyltransferase